MDPLHPSAEIDAALARSPDAGEGGGEGISSVRERILLTARDQYFKLGFSRVTMDETASILGISKKTLYQHFASKEDLVRAVCDHHQQETEAGIRGIHQSAELSPLQKLQRQTEYISAIYRKMSPSLIHDLQRSQPEIWKSVEERRQCCIETDFLALIREGKREGTFRGDIDETLFLKVYLAAIEGILKPSVLNDLPFRPEEVYETVSRILFEGFLTDKARTDYHEKT
jgi:AcrR family transcriptional regulator